MVQLSRDQVVSDMNEAAERMGLDLEDLQEMITDVVEDCRTKANSLKEEIAAGNADEVKAIAHDIKGGCLNYGLNYPGELSKEIEELTVDPKCAETVVELIDVLKQLEAMKLES